MKDSNTTTTQGPGSLERMVSRRLVVSYGGGVNSSAMLVEMHKRGIRPDLCIFADTGGERPETMDALLKMSEWNKAHGLPEIVVVREKETLEENCLRGKRLPSIAYGFKSCSEHWKARPCNRYLKTWLTKGEEYTMAIGYDAGEERRMRESDDGGRNNWYPLIEWKLWRDDCEEICRAESLPVVKSSCFFCPSMKKHEIYSLKKDHPDLAARAVAMENNAELITLSGLGRNFAWRDLLKQDEDQLKLFTDAGTPEIPCGCYDG